jgi:hypothetical protein
MIAAAHQPHFLPWLGYLNKVVRSDVFIWLDTVQYRKNYFQNRTRIAGTDGVERWLTLPVHAHLGMPICEVALAEPQWRERSVRTIEQTYRRATHFAATWEPLRDALFAASDHLADVNRRLFDAVLALLGVEHVRVVAASSLHVDAAEPTDRLVALCRAVQADRYIAGRGGRQYMRVDAFRDAGIDVCWQAFDVTRTAYERAGEPAVPGLSVVDALFHAGPARTRALVEQAWTP